VDFPEQLELVEEAPPNQESFALIGKLLTLRSLHSQLVRDTMASSWNFASPLAVETLAPNKFLFANPLQSHVDRILQQGPWNIRGSLLLLQPWSPDLALEEVELHLCPFWIQLHGLPTQNMTLRNANRIGKVLGNLLEAENHDVSGLICHQHLRLRVELNTSLPLNPGFHIPRSSKEPLWISFKYEQLADYCNFCGLIGHKKVQLPYCIFSTFASKLQNFSQGSGLLQSPNGFGWHI
jgi:hypothetical protein